MSHRKIQPTTQLRKLYFIIFYFIHPELLSPFDFYHIISFVVIVSMRSDIFLCPVVDSRNRTFIHACFRILTFL